MPRLPKLMARTSPRDLSEILNSANAVQSLVSDISKQSLFLLCNRHTSISKIVFTELLQRLQNLRFRVNLSDLSEPSNSANAAQSLAMAIDGNFPVSYITVKQRKKNKEDLMSI